MSTFRHRWPWHLGSNSYWFATSYKWFVMLLLLPMKTREIWGDEATANTIWGTVVMVGALEATVGPAICGYISDKLLHRLPRSTWVVIGALLTFAALFAFVKATTIPMLTISYLILQVSDDLATGPYSALIPDLVPAEHHGYAAGYRGMLDQGARVAGALTLMFVSSADVRVVAVGGMNIVCALWVYGTTRGATIVERAEHGEAEPLGKGFFAPWKSRDFRILWFSQFLTNLGFYLIFLFGQNFLIDQIGVPKADVTSQFAKVAVLLSLTAAVTSVIAGRLADRYGRRRTLIWAGVWCFLILLPIPYFRSYMPVLAFSGLFGIGFGPLASLIWAVAADVIGGSAEAAKDMGLWQSAVTVPQLFAGLIGSAIDGLNRQSMGLGYTTAFMTSSVVFLVGSAILWQIKRTT